MDVILKSPLTLLECCKRLDTILVTYHPQLPVWNWPLRKMIGAREGTEFTCALYFSGTRRSSIQRLRLNAAMESQGKNTMIQGDFDTENWEFYLDAASIYFTALSVTGFLITLLFCISDLIQHTFNTQIWVLMGFFIVSVSFGIWIWQHIPHTLEKGKNSVKRFLMQTLDAQLCTMDEI
jgi:hypothetical protein